METWQILVQLAAILISARVFGELAARFNAPAIIGELLAGVILGPSLLAWVTPNEILELLAEIGIILLLFEVGLDTDFGRLMRAGPSATAVAVVGFIAPFAAGYGLSRYLFDLPLLTSLFIAGTLTATSIGITVRILVDLGRNRSSEGQVVLGAAVVDDLLGVFLLAIVYEFAVGGSVSLANAGRIILYVGLFFVLAPVAAKMVSPVIKHFYRNSDHPGVVPTSLVALVLLFAALAHVIGAPELLGGFAAGIALSRRFFLPFGLTLKRDAHFTALAHRQMKPIIQLFTPIFFVMVGLSLDLSAVDWASPFIWVFSIGIAVVAILGKILGGLVLRGETIWVRTAIGMAMVPRGEVGLIFAELGRVAGVFDEAVYAGMVLVIAYTTLFSPFWLKLYYRQFGDRMPAEPVKVGSHPVRDTVRL